MDRRQRARLYLKDSPTKARLLRLVLDEPAHVTALAEALGIAVPSAHQHVEEMVALGLVTKEKVGRRAYVAPTALARDLGF